MDLLPTTEQTEIVAMVGDFLSDRFPTSTLRERADEPEPFDSRAWAESAELGWFGLGLADEFGGAGLGMAEEALVFRELGRRLAPGPFVATTLAARLAATAGAADLAGELVGGESCVALAVPRGELSIGATVTGDVHLFDHAGAGHYLVIGPDQAALVASDAVVAEPVRSIDEGTRVARSVFDATPTVLHADGELAAQLWRRGTVLVSAMLTGIAEGTRDQASEYAKQRVQFGKPIGVNQAIKHACADMALRAEAAGAQLVFAALSVDEGRTDTAFQVASARVVATDAAIVNASANVQVHGGMGYTYEHDANLYVKRVRILDRMLGDRRTHLAALLREPPAQ